MRYACNYQTIKNNKINNSYINISCFYKIWNFIQEYDYIKYFIFKDYSLVTNEENPNGNYYNKDNHNLYSKSDIVKYINILNKLPNNIELNVNDEYSDKNGKTFPAYSFKISTKNALLCKIQLNCIRYLHENENWNNKSNYRVFKNIPKTLIEINTKLKTINTLNKIILSHYISKHLDGGHDFIGHCIKKLYTKQQYLKLIKNHSKDCYNVFNTLNSHGNFRDNEKEKLIELMKKDVKKAYIYYKSLLKRK